MQADAQRNPEQDQSHGRHQHHEPQLHVHGGGACRGGQYQRCRTHPGLSSPSSYLLPTQSAIVCKTMEEFISQDYRTGASRHILLPLHSPSSIIHRHLRVPSTPPCSFTCPKLKLSRADSHSHELYYTNHRMKSQH